MELIQVCTHTRKPPHQEIPQIPIKLKYSPCRNGIYPIIQRSPNLKIPCIDQNITKIGPTEVLIRQGKNATLNLEHYSTNLIQVVVVAILAAGVAVGGARAELTVRIATWRERLGRLRFRKLREEAGGDQSRPARGQLLHAHGKRKRIPRRIFRGLLKEGVEWRWTSAATICHKTAELQNSFEIPWNWLRGRRRPEDGVWSY